MFKGNQLSYRKRPIPQVDADIKDNFASFIARSTMNKLDCKKLESNTQFNYTHLANNFTYDNKNNEVSKLDSWKYCDVDTGTSLLQLFRVHRKSVYDGVDGMPTSSKKLEQCESCGTFKERRSKGQMDTSYLKTLTQEAMMDQNAFDIKKLSCTRCCTTYTKVPQSISDIAAHEALRVMSRKKAEQKYNAKRYEKYRNDIANKVDGQSTMIQSATTASTAPSFVKAKLGRPYKYQMSDISEDEGIQSFQQQEQMLDVRLQPNQVTTGAPVYNANKHLVADVDSDAQTVYVGSQSAQEHTESNAPVNKTKKQIQKKVKSADITKVLPKPTVKRESRAIKFAIKGASTTCEKDVMVQMLQTYANLVRQTTGYYVTEACKTDKCRVLLLELNDADASLSRRSEVPVTPAGWIVQRVTFPQLLAFVGGTSYPDDQFVQIFHNNFTWNLNFSSALQGHVKSRNYTTHAPRAKHKRLRGSCLYVSLDLALELYRLNPSTDVKNIPESMQNIQRSIEQSSLIELLVDSMKLNRKGHAYYTQLVYVFDRNLGLLQQSDYHLLFHINGRGRRYTVSVPKVGDTVWFSNAFQVFANTQQVSESADLKFRDCREHYCTHTVTTDNWRIDDTYDVFSTAKLTTPKPYVLSAPVDHSVTVGEKKGIVINKLKKNDDVSRLFKQEPIPKADQDIQSGTQMIMENGSINNEYDIWEDEVVDLIEQHAAAQQLDDKQKTKLSLQNKLCTRLRTHEDMRTSEVAEKTRTIWEDNKQTNDYLDYLWNYGQIGQYGTKPHGLNDQDWLDIQERFNDSTQLAVHVANCPDGCFRCLRCDINVLCGDGHLHIPRVKLQARVNVVPLYNPKQTKQSYKQKRRYY